MSKPNIHIIMSLTLFALMLDNYPLGSLFLIFVTGVLIDVDHYFWYVCKFKKYNIIKCYDFFLRDKTEKKYKNKFLIFHQRISFLILFSSALFLPYLVPLAISHLIHLTLDGHFGVEK